MNILFITADQWRGECLSAFDHPHVKTPNLDALAKDGVAFKHHYAQATPCGPSRACLYAGMYMQNHRSLLNGTPLDARHTNVALEARKAGYQPALFGYTDVSLDPRNREPDDQTLYSYEGVLPGMSPVAHLDSAGKPWLARLTAKGYEVPDHASKMLHPRASSPDELKRGKTYTPAKFRAEDSSTAFLVDEAIEYLSVRKDDPWFVHMSFLAPHPPYVAPEPYNAQYDAEKMPPPVRRASPEEEAEQHPWLAHYLFNQRGDGYTAGEKSADNLSLSDKELKQIQATYYGMMSEVDAQIGRLIDYLKKSGTYDDTLIIFTSDHGDLLGDHWMLSKFCYFDQAFHVPLIIRHPSHEADQSRGTQISNFTEIVDIMPTILDSIGHPIPRQCDGHSLLPFCRGETPPDWRQEYHAEFDLRSPYNADEEPPLGLDMKRCMVNVIRGERYKYVHFAGLPALFFDLKNDPNEFHNLASDPDYQGLIIEYAEKMLSWRMVHDEPTLTNLHLSEEGEVLELTG